MLESIQEYQDIMTAENFQPQVRDTTNGPNVHTYIPRADGAIVIGGIAYFPQAALSNTTTIPVTVTGPSTIPVQPIPVVATAPEPAVVKPYFIPPGGPAIPAAVTVPPTFQFSSYYPLSYVLRP